ncbi:hypothetical protein WDW86_00935 [Bdellovibrionota bacterium FG-2]
MKSSKVFSKITHSFLISSLSLSATAFAAHYDGPAVDVNFNNQKPAKYAECDQYLNATARQYAACEFGRDEAERMATRFAGGNGRIEGYLRGFSWGLYKMTKAYQNDATEMKAGEKLVDGMGQYMAAGIQAGQQAGTSQGATRGKSDAISRFTSVVDTGKNPDATVRIPETSYEGEDNGYQKYVGSVPTADEIMKKDIDVGQLKVYDDWDALYLGEKQPLNAWDLWFSDGTYVFEKAKWYDKDLAFKVWNERPIDTRPKFDNLNNPPLLIDPATGQPTNDQLAGKQVDLKTIFLSAFKNSYAWYVNYYFAKTFNENIDMGQLAGEMVGTQVGKRLAANTGLVGAFNKKFKESSTLSFRDSFVSAYTGYFNSNFQDYLNNPKLSISFDSVVGAENDGILQPGEIISAKFSVQNIGGVGTPLEAYLTGDVIEGSTLTFNIARLKSAAFTATQVAKIDPRLQPREKAKLVLHVNGLQDDLSETVQRFVEMSESSLRLDVSKGAGEITTAVQNVSTVRTPGKVEATLRLNGKVAAVQELGFIAHGDTAETVLSFSGIDPLFLIDGSSLEAKVTITMEGAMMDSREVSIRAQDPDASLANYFNKLINGSGMVPAGTSREDRVAEVRTRIVSINKSETQAYHKLAAARIYRDNPSSTMLGKVLEEFKSNAQNQASRKAYDGLAKEMFTARKNFNRWFGVIWMFKSAGRKAYEKLCEELSLTGKL